MAVGRRRLGLTLGPRLGTDTLTGLIERSIDGNGLHRRTSWVRRASARAAWSREFAATAAESRMPRSFAACCESHTSDVRVPRVPRMLRAMFGVGRLASLTPRERTASVRVTCWTPTRRRPAAVRRPTRYPPTPTRHRRDIDPDARRRRLVGDDQRGGCRSHDTRPCSSSRTRTGSTTASESTLRGVRAPSSRRRRLTSCCHLPTGVPRRTCTAPPDRRRSRLRHVDAIAVHTARCRTARYRPVGRAGCAARIADRAAGNPFFVEEIVRDLAERGRRG